MKIETVFTATDVVNKN